MLLRESGSAELADFLRGKEPYYTTSLCFGEALGVLKRKWRYKEISQNEYVNEAHMLRAWITGRVVKLLPIDITDLPTFYEAADLSRKYAIDLSDSLQIVALKRSGLADAVLITTDGDLVKATRTESLAAWNCVHEKAPSPSSV